MNKTVRPKVKRRKKDIGTVKVHCVSETLSPLTHMMETAGNESIINREKVIHNGMEKWIPVLSGNSIRHKLIRDSGMHYLLNACSMRKKIDIKQANFLFYGGGLTESSNSEKMKEIAEMYELFPLVRLLGASLPWQIVAGSLIVFRGKLICEENKHFIYELLPEKFDIDLNCQLKSSEDFIHAYQYTRGDITRHKDVVEIVSQDELASDKKTGLMIYNGQCIITGSLFYHGFILNRISRKEVGAFFLSLETWQESGAFLGGYSRIGHGKLKLNVMIEDSKDFISASDIDDCIDEYINHVEVNKAKCIEWLDKNFK
ncbi:MAG: hypothetical protein PVI88_00110 [Nitrosopumilaceae archaeon]|jgi:hypothetical protein